MNKKKYIEEIHMTYNPILGTSYELVSIESDLEKIPLVNPKECNHGIRNITRVGYRTYCEICCDWTHKTID